MKYILFLFVFTALFSSCQTDNLEGEFVVGTDYLSGNNEVILIDTLTVNVSTINFDSLVTSNTSRILLGNYDDPIFGKVKSDSYFQLTPENLELSNTSSDTETQDFVYDSIALILRYDRYYYGDTTKVQSINVHKLTQRVRPPDDDDNTDFYNSSTLTYETSTIGSRTYTPRPIGKDSVNISIDNTFGNDIFQRLRNNEFIDNDQFIDYFKGIVIKSSSDNSANIIGFRTDAVLRLYFSRQTNSDEEDSLFKDFEIQDLNKQFNNITLDRDGTILQNLPASDEKLNSELTNNTSYIQSGTGVALRLDFPFIRELRYISEKGAIVDAELLLKPIKNNYSNSFPLKDSLQVYESDNLNRISRLLTNSDGSSMLAILNKNEQQQDEFNENIGYKINIGSFMQDEMLKTASRRSSLIFTFPNISRGVDRITIGNQKNAEHKIVLKIYYISY